MKIIISKSLINRAPNMFFLPSYLSCTHLLSFPTCAPDGAGILLSKLIVFLSSLPFLDTIGPSAPAPGLKCLRIHYFFSYLWAYLAGNPLRELMRFYPRPGHAPCLGNTRPQCGFPEIQSHNYQLLGFSIILCDTEIFGLAFRHQILRTPLDTLEIISFFNHFCFLDTHKVHRLLPRSPKGINWYIHFASYARRRQMQTQLLYLSWMFTPRLPQLTKASSPEHTPDIYKNSRKIRKHSLATSPLARTCSSLNLSFPIISDYIQTATNLLVKLYYSCLQWKRLKINLATSPYTLSNLHKRYTHVTSPHSHTTTLNNKNSCKRTHALSQPLLPHILQVHNPITYLLFLIKLSLTRKLPLLLPYKPKLRHPTTFTSYAQRKVLNPNHATFQYDTNTYKITSLYKNLTSCYQLLSPSLKLCKINHLFYNITQPP